jgi:acetolactate synthase small subunit
MVDVNQKAQTQGTQTQGKEVKEGKEKKEKRPRMYDTLAMITTQDNGRNIQIITITNNIIIGKLVRVSPYELEVEVKGRDGKSENWIVMKHFIAYLKFTQ